MHRKSFLFLLILIFILSGCQKESEQQEEPQVAVQVYPIEPDSISTYMEITGTLEAGNDAYVYAKVSEKVIEIRKNVGDRVKKDEVIAVLENRIWQERLNQAKAALQSAQARYQQVKQEFERYKRLYQQEAVSEQQWEKIQSSMEEAKAGFDQAEASYQQANEQFENTFIRAPFNGIVGSLLYDEGETAVQGQPVVKIINTRLMKAKLNIPDIHAGKIKSGQRVVGEFPATDNTTYTGRINRIDPAIDPLSRTFQAEAIFNNIRNELKSGMYGTFRIELETHRHVFVVPDNAILPRTQVQVNRETGETFMKKQSFVYVVQKDSANLVEVKTGLEADGRVEIREGLKPGSRVIVVGQKIVRDGQKVRIVE